jgi:P27 family predicted phage terminase small subunit
VLYTAGMLSVVDENLFAAYCEAAGQYRQASMDLQKMAAEDSVTHGAVIKTQGGNFIQNPMIGLVNTLRRDMQRLAAEFGLSPAARASINTPGSRELADPIAEKYFGGNGR